MAATIARLDGLPRAVGDSLLAIPISITLTGNYTTDGDTLDFSNLDPALPNNNPPLLVLLPSPDGYPCEVIPGDAQNNSLILFYTAVDTQLAQAAYPAGLLNKVFQALAIFKKF